jgi:hypothetical protein
MPHLYFSLIFILPAMIVGCNFERNDIARSDPIFRYFMSACYSFVFVVGVLASAIYFYERNVFNDKFIKNYEVNTLNELGDPIRLIQEPTPLFDRVKAIRSELRVGEAVLILSPFDHLLSALVNPKTYCGHFELLTNMAFKTDVKTIKTCLLKHPNVLVVFDDATRTRCPEGKLYAVYDRLSCNGKDKMKNILFDIGENLINISNWSRRDGELLFLRLDPSKLQDLDLAEGRGVGRLTISSD